MRRIIFSYGDVLKIILQMQWMKLLQASLLFFHFKKADSIIYVPVDSQIVIWDELCVFISSYVLFITYRIPYSPRLLSLCIMSITGHLSKS